jgi:serine/threonine-protein kinase
VDGLLFYVMPFVEGESLQDRLDREHQLPVHEAAEIGREVAEALAYAHEHGLVHRDIKPGNVMLQSGHAVLTDFGIARAIGEAGGDKLTATGTTLGTPTYMSPEQAVGEDVDHRADIYALGCVIYEMLAGVAPHDGPNAQVILARKLTDSAPSLSVIRDTVPPQLDAVVSKAMARTPADRFQSATEMAESLAGRRTVELSATGSTPRAASRRFGLPALAALGVVAAAAVSVWALTRPDGSSGPGGNGTGAVNASEFVPLTTQPGVEDSPGLSPDGMWVVYAGIGDGDRDIFLQGVGGRLPINLTADSRADDDQPAFSHDGERIAFRSEREGGGIFVMGRTGEAVRRVTREGFNPAWSPDGTRIVYATEGVDLLPLNGEGRSELHIVDVNTGETTRIPGENSVLPAWSPNGSWIAYTDRSQDFTRLDITLHSVDGGEEVHVTDGPAHDWSPAWSPDGETLYFVSNRSGTMNLWRVRIDPGSGQPDGPPQPVTIPGASVAHPSVSGDGSLIAYASVLHTQNIEIATLDADGAGLSEFRPLTSGSRRWSSPDIADDGSLVVFYSQDLPEGDVYVVRPDGTGLRQVTADSAVDRVPRISPDGSTVTYFSTRGGGLNVWSTSVDGSRTQQVSFADQASTSIWSPDGRSIAVNGRLDTDTAEVFLYDLGLDWSETSAVRLPRPDSAVLQFVANDWSPDGRFLAGQVGFLDEGILVHDLETGEYGRLTDFGQWPVWLPDSRRILFVTGGSEFHVVDRISRESRLIYRSPRDVLGPPRVTADGTKIVFSRRATEGDVWTMRLR